MHHIHLYYIKNTRYITSSGWWDSSWYSEFLLSTGQLSAAILGQGQEQRNASRNGSSSHMNNIKNMTQQTIRDNKRIREGGSCKNILTARILQRKVSQISNYAFPKDQPNTDQLGLSMAIDRLMCVPCVLDRWTRATEVAILSTTSAFGVAWSGKRTMPPVMPYVKLCWCSYLPNLPWMCFTWVFGHVVARFGLFVHFEASWKLRRPSTVKVCMLSSKGPKGSQGACLHNNFCLLPNFTQVLAHLPGSASQIHKL